MLQKYKSVAINVSFALILALFTLRLFTPKKVDLTLLPSPACSYNFGILHSLHACSWHHTEQNCPWPGCSVVTMCSIIHCLPF